jgi:hypothetical protein
VMGVADRGGRGGGSSRSETGRGRGLPGKNCVARAESISEGKAETVLSGRRRGLMRLWVRPCRQAQAFQNESDAAWSRRLSKKVRLVVRTVWRKEAEADRRSSEVRADVRAVRAAEQASSHHRAPRGSGWPSLVGKIAADVSTMSDTSMDAASKAEGWS